jgi:hypothetical protein
MGMEFGWRVNDTRDTVWRGDSALANVPPGALEDWKKDGDASHLLPYATIGKAEVFTFRALNLEESRWVTGMNPASDLSGLLRQVLACFRIGVSFPGAPDTYARESTGQQGLSKTERNQGLRMLALPFVQALEEKYPGITGFYGGLIFNATFPSEDEKKASSPQPTLTQSSGAASMTADTAAPVKAGGEAA